MNIFGVAKLYNIWSNYSTNRESVLFMLKNEGGVDVQKFHLKLDVIFSDKESQRDTGKNGDWWFWLVKGGVVVLLLIHQFFL